MREPISKLQLVLIWMMFALQCPSLHGQAPSRTNAQMGQDFWGYKEGAPEGVESLAQTGDGFLWLATETGLFRFDGIRFEPFRSPFGDKLLSTNVRTLFAPASGGLWIGYTFGGFSFLKNGRVKNYAGEASSTGSVDKFAQNGDGTLWAATTSGLWRLEDSLWHHLGPEWNAPVPTDDVGFDRNGIMWAIGENHLLVLFPGRKQFQTAMKTPSHEYFTFDADGKVLTRPATSQQKSELNSNQRIAYPLFFEKSYGAIVDRMNGVWIASSGPPWILVRMPLSEGSSDVQKKSKGAGGETYSAQGFLRARLVDREGNVWSGDKKGLHRFFYTTLTREELPKELGESQYFSMAPDDHGAVWVTAGDNANPSHLCHVTTGQVELRKLPGSLIAFTYRSPDKTLWLGGTGGLWRLVGGNVVRVEIPKPASDQIHFLQAITEDRRGGMWVSFGRHGLYRLADGVWTPYGGRDDLPKTGAVIEFTDPLGRVWFGFTKSTLAVLDDDRVQVFGPNDGVQVGNVTAIYGRGSEIWIGGEFGLQQFDHGHFHNIRATEDDLLHGISGIVETADGDLWLNALGGILHVPRSEISEALKNSAYPVKGEHFGTREGLPGHPFQLRPLNTAIEGTDGRLWFATSGGVVWLDSAHTTNNVPPTPVTIQSVSADDKNYQLVSELKFPAHTSSVQISYASVSLSDPEAIRYRYKLQEADKDWHEVATANPVNYRNLSPGSYHFSVASTDTNGVWSDKVATTEFTILPTFYQTVWFKGACVLAILGCIYLGYRLRVQQLSRQLRVRMYERIAERTRIAQELHDTLLQSFQGLMLRFQGANQILLSNPSQAKEALEGALDRADQALTESRQAIQGIRTDPFSDRDLEHALRAIMNDLAADEHITKGKRPTTSVVVEGKMRNVDPGVREEICKVAREAFRNAFTHGGAQHIESEIAFSNGFLRVRFRDDGVGIDSVVLKEGVPAGHWGLTGMKERAKRLRGNLNMWSKPGAGTEVDLMVPAHVAFEPGPSWVPFKKNSRETRSTQR
jgi:signal transduction histidine kinase/ligand-binding sensor domain-containing protein